ncbi:hypothetical protein [uncultured Pseudokineococcus sp.]|uniref:hypothetical protein n=1 Tax=uncultured Pseudokineococcus sp. TaxID=1642928 RepID=UPI0026228725|nr:hypothetical protein [uncultured Pseudokineococcus sp.]
MHAQLITKGDMSRVAAAAALLAQHFPDGLDVEVKQEPVDGWTPETGRVFTARLATGTRAALAAVVAGGGFADDEVLRGPDGKTLRGKVTGPMTRHVEALVELGVLPAGTRRPVFADYEEGVTSFHRTKGLHMKPELVKIFEEALRPELHENPTLDAELTEAVGAVLRRHVPDFVAGAGIEHLVVAVRSDDVEAPERNTCLFTGSQEDALTLLSRVAPFLAAGDDGEAEGA